MRSHLVDTYVLHQLTIFDLPSLWIAHISSHSTAMIIIIIIIYSINFEHFNGMKCFNGKLRENLYTNQGTHNFSFFHFCFYCCLFYMQLKWTQKRQTNGRFGIVEMHFTSVRFGSVNMLIYCNWHSLQVFSIFFQFFFRRFVLFSQRY